ncbi:hypothetical protein LCGC14_0249840 [marine sediment metagenome]|uniref:Uncharacterized protein n=1 Tax=marine sediment metagenome TaxID=412755 RepID=A0A0F9WQE2_9ZZZZ
MTTAAERNAREDGYEFTGCYARSYDKDKLKPDAAEYCQQGYRVRTVNVYGGGYSLYIKDTPKTLKAKEEQAIKDEEARQATAIDVAEYLVAVSKHIGDLGASKLQTLKHVIKRELGDN